MKSAVFNNVFFSEYPGVESLNSYSALDAFFRNDRISTNKEDETRFFDRVIKGTFDCYWHQPMLINGVLDDSNVAKLRSAIVTVCKVFEEN
ncbi:hypothetical protein D3C84_1095010 [compost metagenome]